MKNKITQISLVILGTILLYLLFWPVEIDPAAWTPPEPPELTGVYAVNNELATIEKLAEGHGVGPEDVAIDSRGYIYSGLEDGRVIRLQPDGSQPETFANTGGRPLGMHFDGEGKLIVADGDMGLLSILPDGTIIVLTTEYGGMPYMITDDIEIGPDGMIYFSDASYKHKGFQADLMEHRPNGRLLAYDPTTDETTLLLDDLYFANGVAVAPDNSFVLVSETGKYRIRQYWLSGPKAGSSEVFIENLPGFPDGVSSNGAGIFWVALASPRKADVDAILPLPFVRKMVMRLPQSLLPAPDNYGFVLGLDIEGNVVYNLQDSEAYFSQITSVQQYGNWLYFGSLAEDAIGRMLAP